MHGTGKVFRLALLGALYFAQGVPWGFVTITVVSHLTTLGMGATDIARLTAIAALPWTFKPALGPLVDLVDFGRFGRRKPIILIAEILMAASTLALARVDAHASFDLFLLLVFVHNAFGAAQDVATDGLAVQILQPAERGTGNGIMMAAKYLGVIAGGGGLTWATAGSNWALGATVTAVMVALPLPLVLRLAEPRVALSTPPGIAAAAARAHGFLRDTLRAFKPRVALLALPFALVFATGEYFLSPFVIPLLQNDLGFKPEQVGQLSTIGSVTGAVFGLVGGWLSDRLGRRRTIVFGILGAVCTTIAVAFLQAAWGRFGFQATYAVIGGAFGGILYASSLALFMDLTHPAVAATQFQIYMAVLNLRFQWATRVGGYASTRVAAPAMFVIAAAMDLVALAFLWFFSPVRIASATSASGRDPAPPP